MQNRPPYKKTLKERRKMIGAQDFLQLIVTIVMWQSVIGEKKIKYCAQNMSVWNLVTQLVLSSVFNRDI